MPRIAREKSENGYYHVMVRGNNRNNIFLHDEEKERLLNSTKKREYAGDWIVYGYCIMDNHAHLLVQETQGKLSNIMKRINISYSIYYNRSNHLIGHVFQDRFKSQAIKDDRQLLAVVRYIHQNPIKAKIVEDPEQYYWSSYREFLLKENQSLTKINEILDLFGTGKNRIKEYIQFHREMEEKNFLDDQEDEELNELIKAKELIWQYESTTEHYDQQELVKVLLVETNLSQRKIAELMNISRTKVQRATKGING